VYLTTESNLATFNFFPDSNEVAFVDGTDIPVGSGCTDFAVSPDGNRLAYACPNGNNETVTPFAIHDLDPVDYHNPDGEWYLGSSPVSATFSEAGDMLIATDGNQLFFFDVVTHLLLEKYDLGIAAGDVVKKIRLSRDGQLLLVFLENDLDSENGKMLWMPMPDLQGTPLL
jgi:DNA-binding beta-propeller fold protein YncE